jgi:hypothetical protein
LKSGKRLLESRAAMKGRLEAYNSFNLGAYLSRFATWPNINVQRWGECIVQHGSNCGELIRAHGEQIGVATKRRRGESANDDDIVRGNFTEQSYAKAVRA